MKNSAIVAMAVLVVVIISSTAASAAGTRTVLREALYDIIYTIQIPDGLSGPDVANKVTYAGSWQCGPEEVQYEYTQFYVTQSVPELTVYNASKISLSGFPVDEGSGMLQNIEGYLSFAPAQKMTYIAYAGKYCYNQYRQDYDASGNLVCIVESEMTCSTDYYLSGQVVMTVEPYQASRTILPVKK